MAERASMIHPPIEDLLDQVDAKFSLVTLAAKRARQINSYFSQLGEGLGMVVPPQVASVSRKPLSIALEEIAAHKIAGVQLPDAPEGVEVDEAGPGSLADAPVVSLADEPSGEAPASDDVPPLDAGSAGP